MLRIRFLLICKVGFVLSTESATEKGEEQIELVLDRKIFLDVLCIVMHNANQMLLDVFKRCYIDHEIYIRYCKKLPAKAELFTRRKRKSL